MYGANPSKAILGGFIATLIMTMMMYAAPMMGMPKMDIAAMLGSMFAGGQMPASYSGTWWMGMLVHFVNGTVIFALIYAYLLHPILAGSPWLRGLEWGLVLWFLAQVIAMPVMGMGVFSANSPESAMSVMGSLIGDVIYGVILGAVAGPQAVRAHGRTIERHA